MSQTRRLAAIPAVDFPGYSPLIGTDEGGTLERLKALRRELLDPKIAEHRGRLVKTTSDGLLVEFGSVVDAVRCVVDVQQAMPGLFQSQSGPRPRFADFEPALCFRWVIDPGPSALLLQTPICLRPRRGVRCHLEPNGLARPHRTTPAGAP
jgi:hypothetical protein